MAVAGRDKEWTAELTGRRPEARVAWKSEDGTETKGDPERFKQLIESPGSESGAWRGSVEQDPAT